MTRFYTFAFFLFPALLWSQPHWNTENGLAVKGYDVVSYFNDKPAKGNEKIHAKKDSLTYWFVSETNKKIFLLNPGKYIPQYGGWCAYAMGSSGKKVDIDPETFEIRDGRLYLFYNRFFTNTKKSWLEEGPEKLRTLADENWKKVN